MRKAILVTLVIGVTIIPSWGQQTSASNASRAELLAQLRSQDAMISHRACRRLSSDPVAMRDEQVRATFLEMLDKWNQEVEAATREAEKPDSFGDEEEGNDGDTGCDVFDTVSAFADWSDPRQACILVGAVAYATPDIANAIAAHPKVTIPCLVEHSLTDVISIRSTADALIVRTLAQSNHSLSPEIESKARREILRALRGPVESVQLRVVEALGAFAGVEMIPALEEAAKSDAGKGDGQRHFVRAAATEAIAAIQKRALTPN